jgi:hypothetical protein
MVWMMYSMVFFLAYVGLPVINIGLPEMWGCRKTHSVNFGFFSGPYLVFS